MQSKNFKVTESNMDEIYEEIKKFLQLYLYDGDININDDSLEDLFELSHEELTILKVVHFMLSNEVENFIRILPNLVRNLAHSTIKETEISQGIIRGSVDWGSTLKHRYSKGFNDKSLFVCNPSLKYYDLEENQLLKFLLKKISYFRKHYLGFIKNVDREKIDENKNWYNIINYNFQNVNLTLKKVYFRDISDVKISFKHLRKCIKNKNYLYNCVAKVYMLYEDLFINENNNVLIDLINKRIIKTTDENKLYELYIFFKLVDNLPDNVKHKLLYKNNNYFTECIIDNLKITIYYQFTPPQLDAISQYKDILNNYNIKKRRRAPDIIIQFEIENHVYYRLIEVKNSFDVDYVRDSVYKVMGYYKDFEKISSVKNLDYTSKYPIVLITGGGISLKGEYNPFNDKEIIILNHNEFKDNISKLINL